MSLKRAGLVVVLLVPVVPVHADILSEDEMDAIASPDGDSDKSGCGLQTQVAVQLTSGKIQFPYGPPGLKTYKGLSQGSGLGFDVSRKACESGFIESYDARVALANYFPSNGRQYDVQAVSWLDLSASTGLTFSAVRAKPDSFLPALAVRAATGAGYERFLYARGVFSFQAVPAALSGVVRWSGQMLGEAFNLGLQAGSGRFVFSRILRKYNPARTSSSVNASVVQINPDKKLSGVDHSVEMNFGFSTQKSAAGRLADECCQHIVTLGWNSRTRTAEGFMTESHPLLQQEKTYNLDLKHSVWVIRWSEKI